MRLDRSTNRLLVTCALLIVSSIAMKSTAGQEQLPKSIPADATTVAQRLADSPRHGEWIEWRRRRSMWNGTAT